MLLDDPRDEESNPTESEDEPQDIDLPEFDTVQESDEPDDDKIVT